MWSLPVRHFNSQQFFLAPSSEPTSLSHPGTSCHGHHRGSGQTMYMSVAANSDPASDSSSQFQKQSNFTCDLRPVLGAN